MYIFEGRGKGATWSLLLEELHYHGFETNIFFDDYEEVIRQGIE